MLVDSPASWEGFLVDLEEVDVVRVAGTGVSTVVWGWRRRAEWLASERRLDDGRGPWQVFARLYRDRGDDRGARRLLIAMHNATESPWRRWLFRPTIGYGFQPWLAAVWFVGLLLLTIGRRLGPSARPLCARWDCTTTAIGERVHRYIPLP